MFTASTVRDYLIFFLSVVVFHRAAALDFVSVFRFWALLGYCLVMIFKLNTELFVSVAFGA